MAHVPVQICETVSAPTTAELRAARDASAGDLVELRLDTVADVNVAGALADRRAPVVVTCRPVREGGRFDGDERERLGWLAEAVRLGAEYVDLEWDVDRAIVPRGGRTRLVVSRHDCAGMPRDLPEIVGQMRRGAEDAIVKVAVTPSRLSDCLTLRSATAGAGDHVAIGMGAPGLVSRLCPAHFGSCWTYAGTMAPGQPSVSDLTQVYRVPGQHAGQAIYGVAGSPIAHSASPAMHNAAFEYVGLDAVYVPCDAADADDLLTFAAGLGVRGLSVTAPLKAGVAARADVVSPVTERTGAANTLRWIDGRVEAANFDGAGFMDPLDARGIALDGRRAVVLGAGGAARAAAFALAEAGAVVEIAARRREEAAALAAIVDAAIADWPPAPGWDLLVNATPAGTWPDVEQSPMPVSHLAGGLVYDLVYNPIDTRLMRDARAAGLPAIGGLEMLVGQARRQLLWWTGLHVPDAVLDGAARRFLASRIMTESRG